MFRDDIDGLLLNDILLPEQFIQYDMLKLDVLPLRLYLRACLAAQSGEELIPADYCQFLTCSLDEVKHSLIVLSLQHLIELDYETLSFKLIDLKKRQIHKLFPLQEAQPPKSLLEQQNDEFKCFLQSVNETFFHGKMTPAWYNALSLVKEDYHFDNDVIYFLVQDVSRRNKLRTPTYLRQVAKAWHERGVVTFSQLQVDQEAYNHVQQMIQFVQQKLRRVLTDPEANCVKMWVEVFSYSEIIVAEALSKSIYYVRPTLDLFHRILTEWHEQKLDTLEAVRAYEAEKKTRIQKQKSEVATARNNRSKPNFKQRDIQDNASQLDRLVLDLKENHG